MITLICEESSVLVGSGTSSSSPVTVTELMDCGLSSLKARDALVLVPSECDARNLEGGRKQYSRY